MADMAGLQFSGINMTAGLPVSDFPECSDNSRMESKGTSSSHREVSWDDLAHKLIKEKFLLTALELHAELMESGLELPKLRDFFSNPGNFESAGELKAELSPGLPRTSSIQTLDSLDFARYSDDGDRQIDERVAVLEFELRKARETIKSLRANLTEAAESEVTTPDSHLDHAVVDDPIKPHEKRALNFLVNEYLLKHNYKLTAITFSDENEDQDFEDWDDVGLNVPKPPPLLLQYRDFSRQFHQGVICVDVAIQVDLEELTKFNPIPENVISEIIEEPCQKQTAWMCGPSSPSAEDASTMKNALVTTLTDLVEFTDSAQDFAMDLNNEAIDTCDNFNKMFSDVLEQSEITTIPDTLISDNTRGDDLDGAETDSDAVEENSRVFTRTDDSCDESQDLDIELVSQRATLEPSSDLPKTIRGARKNVSQAFHTTLIDLCRLHKVSSDNRLAVEVTEIIDSSNKVILMLARCLPHIVPNVILAKREELIPVILCTISLHPNSRERDKLLNILFNLIKRPDEDQRPMILTGFLAIAQHIGPTRVESELLPQCWEQINHRYPERRLLVAEACGVLIPYIPNEIRSSLVLSMLQQMLLDDKADLVREAVVKSLAILFMYIDDVDKFSQGLQLFMLALVDSSERVTNATLQLLLPSFAAWAKSLDKLESDLISGVIKLIPEKIGALSQSRPEQFSSPVLTTEEQGVITLIQVLITLLPWLFLSVVEAAPCNTKCVKLSNDSSILDVGRFPSSISPLCDVSVIVGDENLVASMIAAFENYISEEWYETWNRFDWLTKTMLPSLVNVLVNVGLSSQTVIHTLSSLFYWLCRTFGRHFTNTKIKPLFTSTLRLPGEDLDSFFGKNIVVRCLVPVYACGVLSAFNHEADHTELTNFLKELLSMLSLCHLALDSIQVTINELRSNASYHDVLLAVLWDGVVHTSALVRCSAATLFELMVGHVNPSLLSTKVAPALVTLANDPEISVRISTVPTFGAIIESSNQKDLLAKAQMQLQTFLDDSMYKNQHTLHREIIRTFGRVAPSCDPRFRDEFVLPHLVALSSHNNRLTNETKRIEIAYALLETFSAMSCCFIREELICELVLPGLKCLHYDIQQLAPEHEEAVIAMIHEFESKIETPRHPDRINVGMGAGASATSMDDVRNRVSKIFAATKSPGRSNIQNIFQLRKK